MKKIIALSLLAGSFALPSFGLEHVATHSTKIVAHSTKTAAKESYKVTKSAAKDTAKAGKAVVKFFI